MMMAEINEIALVMAIQAVDDKIWALQAEVDNGDEANVEIAHLEDELLSYMKAATDLRVSYEEALKLGDNMTPYETLVRKYAKD
jgi:hypothetical protein